MPVTFSGISGAARKIAAERRGRKLPDVPRLGGAVDPRDSGIDGIPAGRLCVCAVLIAVHGDMLA